MNHPRNYRKSENGDPLCAVKRYRILVVANECDGLGRDLGRASDSLPETILSIWSTGVNSLLSGQARISRQGSFALTDSGDLL
jgi:hypothetical protein